MKRRINWKFFGLLVATVVVAGGAIHGIHLFQVKNVASSLLSQAKSAEVAGDSAKAEQAYLQYLGYEPGDRDALSSYALILSNDPKINSPTVRARAIQALERAVTREPLRMDIRQQIAKLLLDDRRIPDALGHIDALLENSPNDATHHELKGRCHEENGQLDKAIEEYTKARNLDPKLIDAYARLAIVYRKLKRPDVAAADKVMDAETVGDGLIHNNPESSKAFLTRARYRREFKIAGFAEDIAQSLKLSPDDSDALFAAAEVARAANDPVTERKHIEYGLKLNGTNAGFYRSLAALEAREGKVEAAVAVLRRGIEALPEDLLLRWQLADLLVQSEKYDEASKEVTSLRELQFLKELADSIDGQILFRQHKWSQAAKMLGNVAPIILERGLIDQAKMSYITLAQCHERLGNPDQQLEAFRKAVSIATPNNLQLSNQARAGLASSYAAMNRGDLAIEEFQKLANTQGSPASVYVGLIQQMIIKNRRLPVDQRDWKTIGELIDTVERNEPNLIELKLLRVEMLVARDQLEAAAELLEKTKQEHPEVAGLWIAQALLANRQGRDDEVPKILDDAAKTVGDLAQIRIVQARYAAIMKSDQGKAKLAELSKGLDKYPDDVRRNVVAAIGTAYAQLGDTKTAIQFWSELAAQRPEDLEPKLILFDLATRDSNEAAMREQIEALHALEGEEGSYWRYGEARLLFREAQALLKKDKASEAATTVINKGRKLLQEAIERRQNWSRAVLAIADFDDLNGQSQNALLNYRKAIALGEREERAVVRSVQLLNKSRRYAEADKLLRELQQERPLIGNLGRLAADASVLTQDFGRALDLAEKTILSNSQDPRDHLWLGQLRAANSERATEAGRLAEADKLRTQAEQSFLRAIELAPTDPASRIVFIRFLAVTKQISALESQLADSDKDLTPGRAALVRAQSLELTGQAEAAIAKYREALAESPDEVIALRGLAELQLKRGDAKEAEETLRTMAALGAKAPEDSAVGKRVLAMLLASSGDHRRAVQALELLGNDEIGQKASVEDRRARARILARQANRPQRRAAIRLLETINAEQLPQADDQYLLAQLYEADGDWPAAKAVYQSLLTADPKNGTVILTYVRSLIRRKAFDEAKVWVKKLDVLIPARNPALLEVNARLLAAQNRGAEAATLARSIIEIQPNQAPAVALLLEEIGETKAAEDLFRQIAADPKTVTNPLLLAEFLGRHGRAAEALDICDQSWATCPPEMVATDSVLILYNSPAEQDLCKRVITRLEEAVKLHPDESSYQFALANVYVLQRRYNEAEAIYRKTAETDKENASSLNNLAWLLAIQKTKASEALEVANTAIKLAGPKPQILDTRALAYMLLGRSDLAIKDLEDALAVDPTPEIYIHLARAYWMADRNPDALEALRKANGMGLTLEKIHPLEREAYKNLLSEVADRGLKL